MADNQRSIISTLRWEQDTASLARTLQGNQKMGDSVVQQQKRAQDAAIETNRRFLTLDETAQRLSTAFANQAAGRALDELAEKAARGEINARGLVDELQRLGATEAEIDRVAASIERATRASAGLNAGSSGSGRLDAIDRFGSVGSQVFGGLGQGELANAAGLIGDVAGGVATLNPILAGTVAVGGAVSLVIAKLNEQYAQQVKVAEDAANRLKTQAELVASGATTDAVQRQIENLKIAQDVIDARAERLRQYYAEAEAIDEQFYQSNDPAKLTEALSGIFSEVSELTGTTITDFSELQLQISKLSGTSAEYGMQVFNLNDLLRSNVLTANDNRVAVEGFVDTFKERFGGALRDGVNAVNDFADRQREANERAKEAQDALSANMEDYFAALRKEGEAREALTKAQEAETDALTKHVLNMAVLQQKANEQEAELWRKAGEDTLEAQAKNLVDRQKQEAAYYKQVQEIQRRASATMANAVAARDVMAFVLARQQRAEDLRKAKEDNDERLKQLDDNLKEQKDVIAKRLQEQLAAQRKAADDAMRTEVQRYQREAQLLAQATAQAQQQLMTAQTTSNMLLQNYYTQALMYTQTFVNNATAEYARLISLASGSSGGSSTGNSSQYPGSSFPISPYTGQVVINDTGTWIWNGHGWQPGYGVAQYAAGTDYVPATGMYKLHEGEAVLTKAENRGRQGVNFSPVFNLTTTDEHEMIRMSTETLREYIRAAKAGKKGRTP